MDHGRCRPSAPQRASPACQAVLFNTAPVTCTYRARIRAAPPGSHPMNASTTTSVLSGTVGYSAGGTAFKTVDEARCSSQTAHQLSPPLSLT